MVFAALAELGLLKKASSNSRRTSHRSAHTNLKRPSSLTLTLPSFTMEEDERLFSDCTRTSEVWEPLLLYPPALYVAGDCKLSPAMFPGKVLLVFGVRARRGRSVGGRGAGPGFINWSREYILARKPLDVVWKRRTGLGRMKIDHSGGCCGPGRKDDSLHRGSTATGRGNFGATYSDTKNRWNRISERVEIKQNGLMRYIRAWSA